VTIRWRGWGGECEQVGNAREDFVDLTPVSEAPAEQTRTNWAALLPGSSSVPLIWEDSYRYGRAGEEDDEPPFC
jgi:hypothetical protein